MPNYPIIKFSDSIIEQYVKKVEEVLHTPNIGGDYFFLDSYNYNPHELNPGATLDDNEWNNNKNLYNLPVSTATAGLTLIGQLLKLKGYKNIILPANTMRATRFAFETAGLNVIIFNSKLNFINKDKLSMDPTELFNFLYEICRNDIVKLTDTAICYVAIGGYLPASVKEVLKVVKEYRDRLSSSRALPTVCDAAHAHFTGIANVGFDYLAYSFYATKVLSTGEGGVVTTSSSEDYEKFRRILIHDRIREEYPIGNNCRMNKLTYELLKIVLDNRHEFIDPRIKIAKAYAKVCDELGVNYYTFNDDTCSGYNAYKFIIDDDRLTNDLFIYEKVCSDLKDVGLLTSPVFAYGIDKSMTHRHICPATYMTLSILSDYDRVKNLFNTHSNNIDNPVDVSKQLSNILQRYI